jgi:hypothetical protein
MNKIWYRVPTNECEFCANGAVTASLRTRLWTRNSHIYCPTWAEFGLASAQLLLGICECCEERRGECRTLLICVIAHLLGKRRHHMMYQISRCTVCTLLQRSLETTDF